MHPALPATRRRILTTALAAAAAVRALPAGEPAPVLRVLCYNIHYGQGNDGEYNLERLAGVIRDAKPDLVGLQEVDVGVRRSGRAHQLLRLAELTGLASRYGPTQHYEGGLFGNAVLTRLPILDVAIHPLPYTEATAEKTTYPRGAIAVTVRAPDGLPLRFISTHFQHNVEEDRVAEAHAINELFASPADETRTVLAGDLNAKPGAEPVQILGQRWVNALDPAAAPTAPSRQPVSRIDYILSRPRNAFRLVSSEVIHDDMASDHRPVLAVFELPKPR